jgi:hypothetical protein
VRESNKIYAAYSESLSKCYSTWRDKLKAISISAEHLQKRFPSIGKLVVFLLRIVEQSEILPDQLKAFNTELSEHSQLLSDIFKDENTIFTETYAQYLEGLNEKDIEEVRGKLPMGMFIMSATESNAKVKLQVESYQQGLLKTKLFNLWKDATNTKSPREWSSRYKMPILCLVSTSEFDTAKKTFETLNRINPTDAEIGEALAFLESDPVFLSVINDEDKRKEGFIRYVVGKYSALLPDYLKVQDALDRMSIEPYDWYKHPSVDSKIAQLAQAEYSSGGSDIVLKKIDDMDDSTLKSYLKQLVVDNMTVGLEIIGAEV